ncbi:di-trans,poly-cis-decaprenylcistransferase [Candidatus Saccharibacteria bacterium]|nr:di-trans,poly-cis-decaprenylcistransferase [Candidatus Saccharibacteria bacterium]
MNEEIMPTHIGFIVDGNRRWAREKGLPTLEGHRKGFSQVEKIASYAVDRGCKYVSFYLFSTENWNRSEEEVSYLMDLLRHNIARLKKRFIKEEIRCVVFGREEPAPEDILDSLKDLEEVTKDFKRGTVAVCFNYGGQWEIADAVREIVANRMMAFSSAVKDQLEGRASMEDVRNVMRQAVEISPETIAANLYHPEVPPCDLIVRTSGEERISGFQLWRASYSEFLFLKKYFPDFTEKDFDAVVAEYNTRSRRFGK